MLVFNTSLITLREKLLGYCEIHRSLKSRLHNKYFTFETQFLLPLFPLISKSLYISYTIGGFTDKIRQCTSSVVNYFKELTVSCIFCLM